jgi:hypothetical protein
MFVPSIESVTGPVTLPGDTPDSVSEAANDTVTGELFHPLGFAGGAEVGVTVGAVLSMLTATLVVAELPAPSVAVPDTTWSGPSADRETGDGQDVTAVVASVHANETVTFVLFHPAALGVGVGVAVIVGRSLSIPSTSTDTHPLRGPSTSRNIELLGYSRTDRCTDVTCPGKSHGPTTIAPLTTIRVVVFAWRRATSV